MTSAVAHSRPARSNEHGEFGTALAEGFARRVGALAQRLGATSQAVRWARRAAFAVSRATSAGHVCVSFERLAQRYGEPPDAAAAALRASGVVSDAGLDAAALKPLVIDAAGRLYLARYYDDERRLATAVLQHATRAPDIDGAALAARLARFFGPPDAGEVDWQRAAAALSLSGRLTVVSGGPGTGKTTTVVGMLACLLDANPSLAIALAAPTGKAAQRMQEALLARAASLPPAIAERLPRTSQTLHRLLGLGHGMRARYGRDNPLPYDVLVVDEASMIDVTLAAQLFDALSPETRLVLLGDKDQLAAVEAGAVFAELSARPSFSAAGIARIAAATRADEARVRAALPRANENDVAFAQGLAGDAPAAEQDALDLFDSLDVLDALDDALAWAGLDEPDASYGVDPAPAGQDDQQAEIRQNEQRAPNEQGGQSAQDGRTNVFAFAPTSGVEPAHIADRDRAPLVDCVVWLERNYRFGLDSAIGRLSLAIRRGDAQGALEELGARDRADEGALAEGDLFASLDGEGSDVDVPARLDEDGGAALAGPTLARLAHGFTPYVRALSMALAAAQPDCESLFDALNAFRILCATRLGARGVEALNAHMAEHVRRAARVPLAVGTNWFAGRAVMVTRNDYALGLFNGDIGIALPTREGALRVHFRTADGGVRAMTPAALPPHDPAFALTVHKSQGSEFDHAALVLPATSGRVLTRELVYTAVTRAQDRARGRRARRSLGRHRYADAARLGAARPDAGADMTLRYHVLPEEVELTAVRAQGAGGQNVNKVSSAIHLRFDIRASSLPDVLKMRLLALDDRRITRDGVVVIKAQEYRTQEMNRTAALERLEALIASVGVTRRPRIPTRPTRASTARRLDSKTRRSSVKAGRTRVID